MRRFILATLFASVSAAAMAETPASCSMAGLTGWPHPADLEALPRADWPKPKGGEICNDAGTSVRKVGGKAFRFAFATIRMPGATDRIGAFVTISRIDGDGDKPLGRFVLPLALVEGRSGAHGVQVIEEGGTLFARLARTEAELFAISGDRIERQPNAGWYGDLIRSLPASEAIGQILNFDLEAMTAYVAVHGARADDPAKPGSAFTPLRAIAADLEWREGRIAVKASRTIPMAQIPGIDPPEDETEERETIRKRVGLLPSGTELCWLSAYSVDKDPKGLNVRSEASGKSEIIGQLPPPMKDPDVGETLAKEFTIIGYKSGWFLIDTNIDRDEPTAPAQAKPGRKRWFDGRGWISARMAGARTAHSGLGEHKLFAAPHPTAHYTVGRQKDGTPMTGDSDVARIHACSFDWALVDSEGGQRGWRRRLCSNQLTTCP